MKKIMIAVAVCSLMAVGAVHASKSGATRSEKPAAHQIAMDRSMYLCR